MSRPVDRAAAHAEAQRTRILDAAQHCFIADGFHAATMATIAERAGVSAGLLYRYFENKDAIVLAIIDRELQVARARIAQLHGGVELVEGMVQKFADMSAADPEAVSPALFLEMSAEATRAPEVADAVARADRLTRSDFQAWLQRPASEGGRGLDASEAASRSLLVQLLFAGLTVRAAREPGLDPAELRGALVLLRERLA